MSFVLRPVEDEGFDDQPRTWWQFALDEALLESHTQRLLQEGGEAGVSPSAAQLLQVFMDKREDYEGDALLDKAARLAHRLGMSLSQVREAVVEHQVEPLLLHMEQNQGSVLLWEWELQRRLEGAEVEQEDRVALAVEKLEAHQTQGYALLLGKAAYLLLNDAERAAGFFSQAEGEEADAWREVCARKGQQEEDAVAEPDKKRSRVATVLPELTLPAETPPKHEFFQCCNGQMPVQQWLSFKPDSQPVVKELEGMRDEKVLREVIILCFSNLFHQGETSLAWGVAGTLPANAHRSGVLLDICEAACRALGDPEACCDSYFLAGRAKESMAWLMRKFCVELPAWPPPILHALRMVALCRQLEWRTAQAVILQLVPDDRALVDAFALLKEGDIQAELLPWIYDNSLLEVLVWRFKKSGEDKLCSAMVSQIASPSVAAINKFEKNVGEKQALTKPFLCKLWSKLFSLSC